MGSPNYNDYEKSTTVIHKHVHEYPVERSWEHSVTIAKATKQILVDGKPRRVTFRADEVQIGCTTLSYDALRVLFEGMVREKGL